MVATTLISHIPSETNVYLGSPSIARLPSGELIVSHDHFGPNSNAEISGKTDIYRSLDDGKNWQHLISLNDAFWSSLFVHQGYLYLLGTRHEHGDLIIRRSIDGRSWTSPSIILSGQWHTAPVPIIEHNGRLWRGVEDAHTGKDWPRRYRARVISIDSNDDLLNPNHWSVSNALDTTHLTEQGALGWLEGNVVQDTTSDKLFLVMRVETETTPNRAALISIHSPEIISYTQPTLIELPGGTKKFSIRYDTESGNYFALTNPVASLIPSKHPSDIRNTLALITSKSLSDWRIATTLLTNDDVYFHGYQYADWIIDGDDLLAVVRTSAPYTDDIPHNFHDSNQILFCSIKNFRRLL